MEAVQVFKTTDGQMFATEKEAAAHEALLKTKAEADKFTLALVGAGYSKSMASVYVRGTRLAAEFAATGTVHGPVKRGRKE